MMQCNPWLIIFILITVFLFPFLLYSCSRFCCTPIPIFTVFLLPGNTPPPPQRLAAWRRAGEHNCSRGCERLKVRQDFLRAYTPPCAKPLVVCSCILLYFIVLSLRKAPIMKFQHLFCFVSIFENLERCQYFLLLQLDKYLFRKFFLYVVHFPILFSE
jgi:hypothetical protein